MPDDVRLKDRVRNPADPDLKRAPVLKPAPESGEDLLDYPPEELPGALPPGGDQPAGHGFKPMTPELKKKFAERVDKLGCVLITALVGKSRPGFRMTYEDMAAIEWGATVVDLIDFYLPQLDTSSPWPPFVMASIGVGAVVISKIGEAPNAEEQKPAAKPGEQKPGAKPAGQDSAYHREHTKPSEPKELAG